MPTGEPAGSIPNVGLFEGAIKGKGGAPGVVRRSRAARASLLEKLLRRGTMGIDGGHMGLNPGDLRLQRLDPRRQLVL